MGFVTLLFRVVTTVYDLVTLPVYIIVQRPWNRRRRQQSTWAAPLTDAPGAPMVRLTPDTARTRFKGCETVDALFRHAVSLHSDRPCLGTRLVKSQTQEIIDGKSIVKYDLGEYKWKTYADVESQVNQIGRGLAGLGIVPETRVIIFAETREEWILTALACFRRRVIVCTIYATLGDEGIVFSVNETEGRVMITSEELLPRLQKLMRRLRHVKRIIYMPARGESRSIPDMAPAIVMPFADLLASATVAGESPPVVPVATDVVIIMYTIEDALRDQYSDYGRLVNALLRDTVQYDLGEYKWKTYADVESQVNQIGRGLAGLGIVPETRVIIFAETREEWILAALACFRRRVIVCTIYATLGDEGIVFSVNETEGRVMITSEELLPRLQKLMRRLRHVKRIIYMPARGESRSIPDMAPAIVMPFADLLASATVAGESPPVVPVATDVVIIMYTSGSTGTPKGVILTNGNVVAFVLGIASVLHNFTAQDVYLGFLPLAHVMEIAAECCFMALGLRIGYSSPFTLTDQGTALMPNTQGDASVLRPTLMIAVPLLLNRIQKAVEQNLASKGAFKQNLFAFALPYKSYWRSKGYTTPLLNRIVFKKTRNILGGRLRVIVSGSAPLSRYTQEFLTNCLCCPIVQGYGLTETTAGATLQDPDDDIMFGVAGPPLNGVHIKLVNWDEGGYRSTDKPYPRGEIVVGGPTVAAGYFKRPELTLECFESGPIPWFYTGDIGEFIPQGLLRIIADDDIMFGVAGPPLNGVHIKLVNWDEGGYRSTDKPYPRGEIVVGGPTVAAGYFKRPELTLECFESGPIPWFYTGDIGEFIPQGLLRIIDRKKDLVKLQYGEYVSLGKVETVLKTHPLVDNVCVIGSSLSTFIVALIQPSEPALRKLAETAGLTTAGLTPAALPLANLCDDKRVTELAANDLIAHCMKAGLIKFEIPRKYKLCKEAWTPESELVTAALKIRRIQIQAFYVQDIKDMYKGD
ncbi:long-chain-fatty-acid--CoA ligase 3 [Ixodes scapularis]